MLQQEPVKWSSSQRHRWSLQLLPLLCTSRKAPGAEPAEQPSRHRRKFAGDSRHEAQARAPDAGAHRLAAPQLLSVRLRLSHACASGWPPDACTGEQYAPDPSASCIPPPQSGLQRTAGGRATIATSERQPRHSARVAPSSTRRHQRKVSDMKTLPFICHGMLSQPRHRQATSQHFPDSPEGKHRCRRQQIFGRLPARKHTPEDRKQIRPRSAEVAAAARQPAFRQLFRCRLSHTDRSLCISGRKTTASGQSGETPHGSELMETADVESRHSSAGGRRLRPQRSNVGRRRSKHAPARQ